MGFKILLTENASPVGAGLFKSLENLPYPVLCPDLTLHDWCNKEKIADLIADSSPAVVVNTLQYCSPSLAIDMPDIFGALALLCAKSDLTIIHLSSSLVFSCAQQVADGAAREGASPKPDSHLGEALLSAEKAFSDTRRSIILRLPWLLDSESGMINAVCADLRANETVVASEHWRVAPVYVVDVVRTVIAMVQQILCGADNWGIFHLHSSDVCSEAEFVDCVARNLTKLGVPIAPIAVQTGPEHFFAGSGWLQGSRCTNDFGVQRRSWRKGIKTKVQSWVKAEVAAGKIVIPAVADKSTQ